MTQHTIKHCTIKSLAALALLALLGTGAELSATRDEGGISPSTASNSSYPLSAERTIATAFPTAEAGFALHQSATGL